MKKNCLIGLTLMVVSFLLVGTVCSAAATTTTAAKKSTDKGVAKFVKIWAETSVLNKNIGDSVKKVEELMGSLDNLKQDDNAGKLKVTNKSIAEVNKALALINKQRAKLVTLEKAAGTIKDVPTKTIGIRLAGEYITVYKLLQDMIKAEKGVLLLMGKELTQLSKGKPASSDFMTKLAVFQKQINDASDGLKAVGDKPTIDQAAFEAATGVTLAK